MIIVDHSVSSLDEYCLKGWAVEVVRPAGCAGCGRRNCLWKHGSYLRRVSDGEEVIEVRIQRFICRHADCRLVVSMLFSFLVPYRQYTVRMVGETVEEYVTDEASTGERRSYRRIAAESGSSRMSIYRWTDLVSLRGEDLRRQIQKECIMRQGYVEDALRVCDGCGSRSAGFARSEAKRNCLNNLSSAIAMAASLLGAIASVLVALHAYFLRLSESRQLIFCGRAIKLQTQHRMGQAF
jgi:hypothetical protein